MKRMFLLVLVMAALSGCTTLKTPEIKGIVVDAETGKPIADARVYATWRRTYSGPGGPHGGGIAKELRLTTDKDRRFLIPPRLLINLVPYPFGQGGSFYFIVYASGYNYKDFSFSEPGEMQSVKYEGMARRQDQILSAISLQRIKNEKQMDELIATIKYIKDFEFVIQECNKFIANNPDSKLTHDLYQIVAYVYYSELKDFEASYKIYKQLLDKYPNEKFNKLTILEMNYVKKQLDKSYNKR